MCEFTHCATQCLIEIAVSEIKARTRILKTEKAAHEKLKRQLLKNSNQM